MVHTKQPKKVVLYIVLGCFGSTEDDFTVCNSIQNRILALTEDFYYFSEIMDFLDGCKLFDKALFDFNAIRNFIFTFKQKFELPTNPVWHEQKYTNYQKFLISHKNCGLFLKLEIPSENAEKTETSTQDPK